MAQFKIDYFGDGSPDNPFMPVSQPTMQTMAKNPEQSQGLLSGFVDAPAPQFTAPTQIAVDQNSTVAGQMNSLLSNESPYIKAARARAKQEANGRGLVNSSLGVQAGELAAIQSALPIAQQDASTNFSNQQTNQNFSNQFKLFQDQTRQNRFDTKMNAGLNELTNQAGFGRQLGLIDAEMNANLNIQNDQQDFAGSQAQLDRDSKKDLVNLELDYNRNRDDLNRQFERENREDDQAFRLDFLDATTNNEMGLADFKNNLAKDFETYRADLQNEQFAQQTAIGLTADLRKARFGIMDNYLAGLTQILGTVEDPTVLAETISRFQEEIQGILDFGSDLESIDLLNENTATTEA